MHTNKQSKKNGIIIWMPCCRVVVTWVRSGVVSVSLRRCVSVCLSLSVCDINMHWDMI